MTAGGKGKEMRKRKTTVVILAALTLAPMKLVAQNSEAAPPTGSKAEAHMSDKGRANTNEQWSADPEKGWVRAEERQQLRDDKKENSKRNQVNRKGNGSKKHH
jgi:hypothetical protein